MIRNRRIARLAAAMLGWRRMRLFSLVVLLAGCGGVSSEAALNIPLGLPRAQVEQRLHAHQYCHRAGEPSARFDTYPRCDRPGTEYGESWVTAEYDGDRLVELRRWERFSDDAHAVERWNQLIADRAKLTPESDEALRAIQKHSLLQPGTRALKAFRIDPRTVVGVYLLTPTEPEQASVLEKISVLE
jgi:hypothetical protein